MLNSALFAKNEGADVVIGYLMPEAELNYGLLLQGLERIPQSGEFDLDKALKRSPGIVLIDGLAHRNAAGGRHLKRYQDAEELLRAGIDVYTTLNIGELESSKDLAYAAFYSQEAGRVPDRIFDQADQVEFIDLSPEELIRKTQGLYQEAESFSALREIAIRRLVDRLDRLVEKNTKYPSAGTREHVLLCLSSAPSNRKVIRTAARLAEVFHGGLTAIFVKSAGDDKDTPEVRKRLKENMDLAEDLGARIATVYGDDPAVQIAEYARAAGVSKVVMGRTHSNKLWLFRKKNLVDRLMQAMPDIDVYMIPDSQKSFWTGKLPRNHSMGFSWKEISKVLLLEAAASGIGFLFYILGLGQENIITVYILGALFSAIWAEGWIYGVLNSLLGVIVFNFLFTEPRFTLDYYDARYAVTFIVMLIASLVTSSLTTRVKRQAKEEARKAYRTEVLLETSHKLQKTEGTMDVMEAAAEQLCKLLDRTILFYPVTLEGSLASPVLFPSKQGGDVHTYIEPEETQAAEWVYQNDKHAGATTNTFPQVNCLYLAVRGSGNVLAVAGIAMGKSVPAEHIDLDSDEKNLMMAMLDECGIVLEKHHLDEERKRAEMKAEHETLRANLLRAISHDLRTPLTSIIGNAGILMEKTVILEEVKKRQLCVDIYDDATWLVNLVENLLSITRIENGTMALKVQAELMEEVFQEALSHLDRKVSEHTIKVRLDDDLLMAKMDVRLIVQVIINIVNNAIKYTPKDSIITVSAERRESEVVVAVADNGPGISEQAQKNLFDMFVTADKKRSDSRRGLGLGLALCKAIINAHGGNLTVSNNIPHGAVFAFTLQIAEVSSYEQTTNPGGRG